MPYRKPRDHHSSGSSLTVVIFKVYFRSTTSSVYIITRNFSAFHSSRYSSVLHRDDVQVCHFHIFNIDFPNIKASLFSITQYAKGGGGGGGGGGAGLRILSDRDDRMGADIKPPEKSLRLQTKPKKIPGSKFKSQKFPFRIS